MDPIESDAQQESPPVNEQPHPDKFSTPVIAIGASAGGLEALKEFFAAMPSNCGMAFVIIQHLDPTHESQMAQILAKHTSMSVNEAANDMALEPNAVYTNPANRFVSIKNDRLILTDLPTHEGIRKPIDHFFASLADERGDEAIGIILSGSSGTDGLRGVREINAAKGICIVQDPETAVFPEMPQTIIKTRMVDYVLPVDRIPDALLSYTRYSHLQKTGDEAISSDLQTEDLESIVKLLRIRTNSDYSRYKKATVMRRIRRRMGLRQISSMPAYLDLLKQNTDELEQLAKDMLICVSSFFRDADAFEELRREVIAPLVKSHDTGTPIRTWIAGCATGEEAYTVAIILLQAISEAGSNHTIQVFASDLDEEALETARNGIYPISIAEDMPPNVLGHFFTEESNGWRVDKKLRDSVVFSRHNLLSDPPFSRLDLISCRNVLIYLEPSAQKKILETCSFALNQGGCLFLGKSEGIAGLEDLFEPVSKPARIYRSVSSNRRMTEGFSANVLGRPTVTIPRGRTQPMLASVFNDATREAMLKHFNASVIITDSQGQILYFAGDTEKYLGHPKGLANLNLLDLTEGLVSAKLRHAIAKTLQDNEIVQIPHVQMLEPGNRRVNLTVRSLMVPTLGGKVLLVLFEETEPERENVSALQENEPLVTQLEAEIKALRNELRIYTEEYGSAGEELKAYNEEIISMNEELQSANEELEASKEELQSLNEELNTLNTQLGEKVNELTQTNDDLANLMNASEVATIFLDRQMHVMRFTPSATKLLNLIPSDKGRPIGHITQNFAGPSLAAQAEEVLINLIPIESEVTTQNRWFTARIFPYRTLDDRIEGVVVTFSDVTRLKNAESLLEQQKAYAESIVETVRDPLIVLGSELRIHSANKAFYNMFGTHAEEALGKSIFQFGDHQWDKPEFRDLLEKVISEKKEFNAFQLEYSLPRIGRRELLLNGRYLDEIAGARVLLAVEDITERKQLLSNIERSNADLQHFANVASHDLQEPLRSISGFIRLIESSYGDLFNETGKEYLHYAIDGAQRMQDLIQALLSYSRITQNTTFGKVDMNSELDAVLRLLGDAISEANATVTSDPLPIVAGDSTQLAQLLQNLIMNALKFHQPDVSPVIHIGVKEDETYWTFSVSDNGIGIEQEFFDRIFTIFQRLHKSSQFPGVGIGLTICKKIVERHKGEIYLQSEPGKGTTFYFTLPKYLPEGAADE